MGRSEGEEPVTWMAVALIALMPVSDRWADQRGIDRDLFLAVACTETGGAPGKVGRFGEVGPWQVWPKDHNPWTWDRPTAKALSDVERNAEWASLILAEALDDSGGQWEPALRRYSGTWYWPEGWSWYRAEFWECYEKVRTLRKAHD